MIGLEFALFDKDIILVKGCNKLYTLQAALIKEKFQKNLICLADRLEANSLDRVKEYILARVMPIVDHFITDSKNIAELIINRGVERRAVTVCNPKNRAKFLKALKAVIENLLKEKYGIESCVVRSKESEIDKSGSFFEKNPDNKNAAMLLIDELMSEGKNEDALKSLEKYLNYHPLDLDALELKFDLCLKIGDIKAAENVISILEIFLPFKEETMEYHKRLNKLKNEAKDSANDSYDILTKKPQGPVMLHIGCGTVYKNGYINIDGYDSSVADVVALADTLPFPENYVECIESYHLIEHLSFQQFKDTMKEWYRILKNEGRLTAECPDIVENMKIFLNSDYRKRWLWYRNELPYGRLAAFYGNQFHDGQFHKNGFGKERLKRLLDEFGFIDIRTNSVHGTPEEGENLQVTARKPSEEKEGFSLILPTYNAAKELRLCLESIKKNSRLKHEIIILVDRDKNTSQFSREIVEVLTSFGLSFNVSYYLNDRHLGPYGEWNRGAILATRRILCFITDDQYFAPNWDLALKRHFKRDRILTSVLVEPGKIPVWKDNIEKNFGYNPDEFDEEKFLRFTESNCIDEIREGGFFIPLLIDRDVFINEGGFTFDGTFGELCNDGSSSATPHDYIFVERLKAKGFRQNQVLSSFSYHFQGSSWKKDT